MKRFSATNIASSQSKPAGYARDGLMSDAKKVQGKKLRKITPIRRSASLMS